MARIVLRGMNGEFRGRTWESSDVLRIGRLDVMEVSIDDASVSRNHAEVRLTEGRWCVRDVGSTNGTRLNGVRLDNGQRPLRLRDLLQFGEMEMLVESVIDPAAMGRVASSTTPGERIAAIERIPISPRKLRLLAAACCRSKWQDFPLESIRLVERYVDGLVDKEEFHTSLGRRLLQPNSMVEQVAAARVVDMAERYADGLASEKDLEVARRRFEGFHTRHGMAHAACALRPIHFISGGEYGDDERVRQMASCTRQDIWDNPIPWRDEYRPILEEIVGPLPSGSLPVDPSWLARNEGVVPKLAHSIYDARSFDDMPILGDALEDCGCTEEAILRHCRGQGRHFRGCWVLDLLTGRD